MIVKALHDEEDVRIKYFLLRLEICLTSTVNDENMPEKQDT